MVTHKQLLSLPLTTETSSSQVPGLVWPCLTINYSWWTVNKCKQLAQCSNVGTDFIWFYQVQISTNPGIKSALSCCSGRVKNYPTVELAWGAQGVLYLELADGRGWVGHLAAESRAESIYTFCSARMHMQTVRNNDIYIYINSIYIYDIIYKYNIYIYMIYI